MERNETIDKLINTMFGEYGDFIKSRFKDSWKREHGICERQKEVAFISISNELLASLSPEEATTLYTLSTYMTRVLKDLEEYLDEYHPAAFRSYNTISKFVEATYEEFKPHEQSH